MLEANFLATKKKGGIGYFIEELSNEQFTSYANVSSLAGISSGTLFNEGQGWLRFNVEGTELIVSKKTTRHSITWDQINAAGCVFGSKVITINGNRYKVRLLKGADHDPTQLASPGYGYHLEGSRNSEWNQLFYPLVKDDTYIPVDIRNPNAPYTNLQLGMITENGRFSWCQETHQENSTWRVIRGHVSVTNLSRTPSSNIPDTCGWRPCLELIPPMQDPELNAAYWHEPDDFFMAPGELNHTFISDFSILEGN